tara:strand:+ start:108 stop:365 length:258 start_codon:yes stop_codon:yes gene_type:complete
MTRDPSLPRPKLFQIVIKGKIEAKGPEYVIKELQLVADDYDLQESIENLTDGFYKVESITTNEIEIGYSAYCQGVFVEGTRVIQS